MAALRLSMIFLFVIITLCFPVSYSLPFVMLHGIQASCKTPAVVELTEILSNSSGTDGYCIEIGNGELDSFFMPMMKQVEEACNKVKENENLTQGYNLVGVSQGGLVGRGLIELCDGPPVKNFTSVGSPQAGIAAFPECLKQPDCIQRAANLSEIIYNEFTQAKFAPSGYFKSPVIIAYDAYIKGSKFLPIINNEIPEIWNSTYKERFSSLEKLVLIMFDNDKAVVPRESSWFGYFTENVSSPELVPAKETKLYTKDLFGLQTLDKDGKVIYHTASGGHVNITQQVIDEYIVPYLKDQTTTKIKIEGSLMKLAKGMEFLLT